MAPMSHEKDSGADSIDDQAVKRTVAGERPADVRVASATHRDSPRVTFEPRPERRALAFAYASGRIAKALDRERVRVRIDERVLVPSADLDALRFFRERVPTRLANDVALESLPRFDGLDRRCGIFSHLAARENLAPIRDPEIVSRRPGLGFQKHGKC